MEIRIDGMLHLQGVTGGVLSQIIKDNTFKNPQREAIRAHSKRPELADKLPKHMKIYLQDKAGIHIPRGYARILFKQYPRLYRLLQDSRCEIPATIPPVTGLVLRDYQQRVLDVIGRKHQGIIEAPTGAGKTVMGLSLMHQQGQRSLVLVHNKTLLNQWRAVIADRLGIEAGIIGDGQWQEGEELTVAMIQTLAKRPAELRGISQQYGLVMVDECHHIPAESFGRVVNELACKYRYGLTATPHRRDGQHDLINRYVGEILIAITPAEVEAAGGTVPAEVTVLELPGRYDGAEDWNQFLQAIIEQPVRNEIIAGLAQRSSAQCPTLILSDRIAHVETLGEHLPDALLVHGGLKGETRKQAIADIEEAAVTIGTFNMLGEGLDISRWGALILATPASGRVRVLQAIGRVLRPAAGKDKAKVFDLVDYSCFAHGGAEKRQAIYQERGFSVNYDSNFCDHDDYRLEDGYPPEG